MFVKKFSEKEFKSTVFIAVAFIFVVSAVGCDKIPFLAKYFPSVKKEEPKVAATEGASQPAASPSAAQGNVLVKIGNWVLTVEEFKERIAGLKAAVPDFDTTTLEAKKAILEELIRQQLLVTDAETMGIANQKEIKEAVEEFRKTLLVREIATKITSDVQATDAETQDYYDKNKTLFVKAAQWHLREIMVPTNQEANEILIEALKGTDFATLAQTRSKAASAAQGGDLGLLDEESIKPEIKTAIATLEVGNVSSVFKGEDNNFYIIKLEEKKGGEPISFDEVKNDIKAGLTLMAQQKKVLEYIDELKKKTTIEVHENLLGEGK